VCRSILAVAVLCIGWAGCIEIPDPLEAECLPGTDVDADGYTCDEGPARDCDDQNGDISPGRIDDPTNLIDEDCSGVALTPEFALPSLRVDTGEVITPRLTIGLDTHQPFLPTSIVEHASATDWLEDPAGVGVRIGELDTSSATAERRTRATGVAMVDTEVTWHLAGPPQVDGITRFSFRPDDSIIRHDQVTIGEPGVEAGTGPHDAATFLALGLGRFDRFETSADPGNEITLPGPSGVIWSPVDPAPGWMCLTAASIGGAGRSFTTTSVPSGEVGPSATIADPAITLGFDWARQADAIAPGTHDSTQIFVYSFADLCDSGPLLAQSMIAPSTLDVTTGELYMTGRFDADQDGYDEGNGWYFITTYGDHISFRVAADQPAFMVRVWFPVSTGFLDNGVTVWNDDFRMSADRDYLVQDKEPDIELDRPYDRASLVLWFPGNFFTAGEITIAAPGGEPS
jgi:hypothetical protein